MSESYVKLKWDDLIPVDHAAALAGVEATQRDVTQAAAALAQAESDALKSGQYGVKLKWSELTPDSTPKKPSFDQWYKERAKKLKLNPNPDDPQHQYDYRAAFKAGAEPDPDGHWPSQFKKPGHPNRFVGGVDTITGKSSKWNQSQADMATRATAAGLPPTTDSRQRLMDAIKRSEKAGYKTQHFIGTPNEPSGDRAVSRDVENLVASLKARESATPAGPVRDAISKERAYWEQEAAEGMTAEEWKAQTGDPEPAYPEVYPKVTTRAGIEKRRADLAKKSLGVTITGMKQIQSPVELPGYAESVDALNQESAGFNKQIEAYNQTQTKKAAQRPADITQQQARQIWGQFIESRRVGAKDAMELHARKLQSLGFEAGPGVDGWWYVKPPKGFAYNGPTAEESDLERIEGQQEEGFLTSSQDVAASQRARQRMAEPPRPGQRYEHPGHLDFLRQIPPEGRAQAARNILKKRELTKEESDILLVDTTSRLHPYAQVTKRLEQGYDTMASGLGAIVGSAAEYAGATVGSPELEQFGRETTAGARGLDVTGLPPGTIRDVVKGVGTGLPFIGLGALGVLGKGGSALLGWMSNSGSIYQEALAAGKSPEEALEISHIGGPVGLTEMFGLGGTLSRAGRGQLIRDFIKATLREMGEEGSQEGVQGVLNNMIAKGLYDPNREILANVGYNTLIGAITGGVVGGGVQAATTIGTRQAQRQAQVSESGQGALAEAEEADLQTDLQPGLDQVSTVGQVTNIAEPQQPQQAEKMATIEERLGSPLIPLAEYQQRREAGESHEDIYPQARETRETQDTPQQVPAAEVEVAGVGTGAGVATAATVAQGPKEIFHEQFGPVTVEGKTSDGHLRVVDAANIGHVIQNPRTQGNQRAAFVRKPNAAQPTLPFEAQETQNVQSQVSPELPGTVATAGTQAQVSAPAQATQAVSEAGQVLPTQDVKTEVDVGPVSGVKNLTGPVAKISPTVTHFTSAGTEDLYPGGIPNFVGIERRAHSLGGAAPGSAFTTRTAKLGPKAKASRYGSNAIELQVQGNPQLFDSTRASKLRAQIARENHTDEAKIAAIKKLGYDGYVYKDSTGEQATAWFYPNQHLRSTTESKAKAEVKAQGRDAQAVYHTGTSTNKSHKTIGEALKAAAEWGRYNAVSRGIAAKVGVKIQNLDKPGSGATKPNAGWWGKTVDDIGIDTVNRQVLIGDIDSIRYVIAKSGKINEQFSTVYWQEVADGPDVVVHIQTPFMKPEMVDNLKTHLVANGIEGATYSPSSRELIYADSGGKTIDKFRRALSDFGEANKLDFYVGRRYNAEINFIGEEEYDGVIQEYEARGSEARGVQGSGKSQGVNVRPATTRGAGSVKEPQVPTEGRGEGPRPATDKVEAGKAEAGTEVAVEPAKPKKSPIPKGFGSKNTIVTRDEATKLWEEFKESQATSRGSGGLSTEDIIKLGRIGAFYIEGGVRDVAEFTKHMIEIAGEQVRSYIPEIYKIAVDDAFTNSMVRGSDGKLLELYHGTTKEFDEFDVEKSSDFGMHFGTSEQAANRIDMGPNTTRWDDVFSDVDDILHQPREGLGEHIRPVYLNIKNPLELDDDFGWHRPGDIEDVLKNHMIDYDPTPFREYTGALGTSINNRKGHNAKSRTEAREAIQRAGYDGIIYPNAVEGDGDSYVVFHPNQIRSAITPILFEDPKFGANNKLVTRDRANQLWKEFKANQVTKRGSGGLDTEDILKLVELGTFYVESGIRDLKTFTDRMARSLGEQVRVFAPVLFDRAIRYIDSGKLEAPTMKEVLEEVNQLKHVQLYYKPLDIMDPETGKPGKGLFNVATGLSERTQKKFGQLSEEESDKAKIARARAIAAGEIKYQLAQENSGRSWYTDDITAMEEGLRDLYPSIKADPNQMVLFKAVLAITSGQQTPRDNVPLAGRVYDTYLKDGKFSPRQPENDKTWSTRTSVTSHLNILNRMIAEKGVDGTAKFLSTEHPVSELRQWNKNVSGKASDTKPGAHIFGPKFGPYFSNISGGHTEVTKDSWFSRSWNRWMGTNIGSDGEVQDTPRNTAERALMDRAINSIVKKIAKDTGEQLTRDEAQSMLWYFEQQLWKHHGAKVNSFSYTDGVRRIYEQRAQKATEARDAGRRQDGQAGRVGIEAGETGNLFEGIGGSETSVSKTVGKPEKEGITDTTETGFGAKNKLITHEEKNVLWTEFKDSQRKSRGSGGLSTEDITRLVKIGAYYVEGGARDIDSFTRHMVRTFRSHLGKDRISTMSPLLFERAIRYVNSADQRDLSDLTGVKNAITDAERAMRGVGPVEKQIYIVMGSAYLQGKTKAQDDSRYVPGLAKIIAERPRPLTATEVGALAYDQIRLKTDRSATVTEIARLVDEGKDTFEQQIHLAETEAAWDLNDQALERGGREQSAAFNARKMIVREDYDILTLLKRVKSNSGQSEVDPQLKAKLETLAAEYADVQKQLGTKDQRIKKLEAELALKRMKNEAERQARQTERKERRVATKKELDDEFETLKKQFADARKDQGSTTASGFAGIDPEGKLTSLAGKMALNRVRAGVNTVEGVVDQVYEALKDQLQGFGKTEVMEAISGYGRDPQRRTVDQAKSELNRLKAKMRRISREVADAPEKAAKEEARQAKERAQEQARKVREARSDEVAVAKIQAGLNKTGEAESRAELAKEAREKKKDAERVAKIQQGLAEAKPELGPREMRMKRLQKRIDDLQGQLDRREFDPPTPRGPEVYDSEIAQLVNRRNRIKTQIDLAVAKAKRTKALALVTSARQSMALLNLIGVTQDVISTTGHHVGVTIGMLPAALSDAIQSIGTKQRTDSLIGPGKLIGGIREGLKKVPKEMKEIAEHGLSTKQAMEQEVPHEVSTGWRAADFILNGVSRFRSIADLPNYEVAFEIGKRIKAKAMAQTEQLDGKISKAQVGSRTQDIYDQMTLADQLDVAMDAAAATAKEEAIDHAKMVTFKNSNAFSDAIRRVIEMGKSETTLETPAADLRRFVIRIPLMFEKAMSNYIKAGFDLSGAGVGSALVRTLWTLSKVNEVGVGKFRFASYKSNEALRKSQHKANITFSRGVFGGAGMMAAGYTLAHLGVIGDPRDDETKRKGRVGSFKIGDSSYDLGWFGPASVPLAIGAGLYYNSVDGAFQAGWRSLAQAPMVRGAKTIYNWAQIAESSEPLGKLATAGGQLGASFLPGVMKDVAKWTDLKADKWEIVDRDAKGLLGPIMSSIPFVRKKLPEREINKSEVRRKIMEGLRKGDDSLLRTEREAGRLTAAQAEGIRNDAKLSPKQLSVQGMSLEKAIEAYRKESDSTEKTKILHIIRKKWQNAKGTPQVSPKTGKVGEPRTPGMAPAEIQRLRQKYPELQQ